MRTFVNKYFEIEHSAFLLIMTLIGLPFFLVGLLGALDVVRAGIGLALSGGNPFAVLDPGYSSGYAGLSKSFFLVSWPVFVFELACVRVWVKPYKERNAMFLGVCAILSFAVPAVASLCGCDYVLWPLPLALVLYVMLSIIVRANSGTAKKIV